MYNRPTKPSPYQVQALDEQPLKTGLLRVPGHEDPFVIIEGIEAASYGTSLASLLHLLQNDPPKNDGRQVYFTILNEFAEKLNATLAYHIAKAKE